MLLFDQSTLEARRRAAKGPLAPLASSLSADLDQVIQRDLFLPREKAKLTRIGGRCPLDGAALTFDPFTSREHRCPQCHAVYRETEHYRWWIMFYQLWLAERAVHAAALFALAGDEQHRAFADRVLERYADAYAEYPNSDNVLGPSRLFFSTYLESIWLLQLCVAVDLLEMAGAASIGAVVRTKIIEPSSSLIAGYDEGDSNRQVWNNAALLASARLLGDRKASEAVVQRQYGLVGHLDRALLADGTWYEGENYHQFAHRGLWYGVTMAERANIELPDHLVARFQSAFAAPFLTALPDFTFPSRRDSPHKVSLRQWRYAESCELGLARANDDRLTGALHALYRDDISRSDTGRWRSAAEAERNEPASALARSDLGWRSLLCARPEMAALEGATAASVLLESQGLGVFRRDRGRVYVALDYGHTGGGHGHPDRLNVLIAAGDDRWLDDPGTGSYVDPTLHWYRSSLAHNAPMFNGETQERVAGTLVAHEERGAAGWIRATAQGLAPHSQATRTLVVMPDYAIDVLDWQTTADGWVDLPLHFDGDSPEKKWTRIEVSNLALSDGAAFISSAEHANASQGVVELRRGANGMSAAWIISTSPLELFRLTAPGAPGESEKPFLLLRSRSGSGSVTMVWNVRGSVQSCDATDGVINLKLDAENAHAHRKTSDGWHIDLRAGKATSSIDLAGVRPVPVQPIVERRSGFTPARGAPRVATIPLSGMLTIEMGEQHYRASEQQWSEAGSPSASVSIGLSDTDLLFDIEVHKALPLFAPRRAWNDLDNEHPDINSDGVQLYVRLPQSHEGIAGGWLMVPEADERVRVTALNDGAPPLAARWREIEGGYAIRCRSAVGSSALQPGAQVQIEVMVNDISSDRERRRGQLVLTGSNGEFIYLQGDRHSGRWMTLRIGND